MILHIYTWCNTQSVTQLCKKKKQKVGTFRALSMATSERGTFSSAAVPVAPTPGGKPYSSTASLRSCNEGPQARSVWPADCYRECLCLWLLCNLQTAIQRHRQPPFLQQPVQKS